MTEAATVTVAYAAAHFKVLPQRIHKYIRDGALETYENARNGRREVVLEEVKRVLDGAPARGRPAKQLGTNSANGVAPSSILVRIKRQEIVRTVHTVTGQAEDGLYSLRSSTDPEGFKDVWKANDVKAMMDADQLFLIDRWAMLAMLAESFEVTGDKAIAEQLRAMEATEKVACEERREAFLDEHRSRMIIAEESRNIAAKQQKETKEKEF
jgi:hypothetical protein